MEILGIDIGGSGIKAAPVDVKKGELTDQRFRIPTPEAATPNAVSEIVNELVKHFSWNGPIGCGFPAAVQQGIVRTASNIDKSWIGTNINDLFQKISHCDVKVINDADAAGLAEVVFGIGKGRKGVIILITIGTGLGTAMFTDGKLLPNTEFGHIIVNEMIGEHYASDATRKKEDLNWKKWAKRFNIYLHRIEALLWPDLIILGGGASKKFDKFSEYLDVSAEVVPAKLLNHAGIIGAALAANSGRT
jgi:polyphosphate glucokinase